MVATPNVIPKRRIRKPTTQDCCNARECRIRNPANAKTCISLPLRHKPITYKNLPHENHHWIAVVRPTTTEQPSFSRKVTRWRKMHKAWLPFRFDWLLSTIWYFLNVLLLWKNYQLCIFTISFSISFKYQKWNAQCTFINRNCKTTPPLRKRHNYHLSWVHLSVLNT